MLRVGLTGGIGSGKSTVATRLVERGAVLVDSDAVARRVVEPGTEGLRAVVERFGSQVLTAAGELDRPQVARLVFADPAARADLNAIVHPLVARETARLQDEAPVDAVVVHDIPLLVELGRGPRYPLTVVVEAPVETRVARLVATRGMTEDDARARIAAQATDEERRAVADVLLPNDGDVEDLLTAVDALWEERLHPFNQNLMADRRPGWPETGCCPAAAPAAGVEVATDPGRRTVARVEAALAHAGLGGEIEDLAAAPGPEGTWQVTGRVADVGAADRAEVHAALRAAGLVHPRRLEDPDRMEYLGADPCLAVLLALHGPQEVRPGR